MSGVDDEYGFASVTHDNPCYCERMDEQLSTTRRSVDRMYITVNSHDENGHPFEMFVRFDDPGYYELTTVISRLASMALREGVDPAVVARELQDIHSPITMHNIPGTPDQSPSLTARIGAVLAKHIDRFKK